MIRLTAGNDTPFIWAVKLQGQPFDLSGMDVKVYVINSRGEIPVASLNIDGNRVSGVFEGRYQTRLGMHSLALRVNEGRPEMKTATVANAFELVQWSADAGGSEAGDVIFAPVVITSELRIGTGGGGEGGGSYDDTAIWKAVNNKVDKVVGKGLSTNDYTNTEKSKLAGLKNYDDTKLKEELAKTYASKEYVDEAVANAGGGGEGGGSYDDTAIWEALNDKVDKVAGKGLSSNDYTTADKLKLSGLKNYDDTQIKKDIEGLSKKIEGLEPGGPGISYDDTELRNAITGLEQSKADKPILIAIEALGTPAHQGEDEVMYWTPEQVEAALSMTLSELYEQAQTREVLVNIMGQTLYPESTMKFEDDLIEFRYSIPTPAVSGFYILNIRRSPLNIEGVNTAIVLGGQYEELATKEELTELSAEVSGLSEKIENLPSGESSMFEATFGETPFADLWNAYQSNKHVVVRSGKFVLSLVCADETIISFSAINNENVYSATCNSSNVWTQGSVFQVEKATNKVTSLSDKSTDTQYPSAKSVYDFVNTTLGTIINGDY